MRLEQNPDSEEGVPAETVVDAVSDSASDATSSTASDTAYGAVADGELEVLVEGTSMPVHLEIRGPQDADRILVLHGWGASTEHMRGLIELLSADFRVAALDFPGHGSSPVPSVGYGMEGHLDVIDAVIGHLGWSRFRIVGHSNGGRAAITWAARHAGEGRLTSLALVAPSGIKRQRTVGFYVKSWTARLFKAPFQILPEPLKSAGLDWLRHSLLWRLLGSSDYRALEGSMRETFVRTVNHYVEELLPQVDVPVLIMRGDQDSAITHEQVETMQRGLSDAGLFTIEGAGHFAQMERPDIVAEAIRSVER